MIGLHVAQPQPIGLDIGHDSIKMLQVSVSDEKLSVVAAAKHVISSEARANPGMLMSHALGVIRQMMRNTGFKGKRVVACLPREIVQIKNLRLPMMPVSELGAVVQFEARNVFAFETNECHVDFLPAGEVRQGSDVRQEVIALAARHVDIDRFLEDLHRAGVIVDSLDLEPCAIYRSVERFVRRREDEHEVFVLVDVGLTRSQVLIGKGRDISFVKPIDVGGAKLNDAVARKLGITFDEARALRRRLTENPESLTPGRDPVRQAVVDATRSTMEELAREVSLCLRYHSVTFRGHRPAKLRMIGGEGSDPQLLAILGSMLPVPIESGKPLFSVDTSAMKPADRRGVGSEWALALGLSLKRTTGRFTPRDGTPRSLQTPLPPTAEVIDLNAALVPSTPREAVESARPTARPTLVPEVANA